MEGLQQIKLFTILLLLLAPPLLGANAEAIPLCRGFLPPNSLKIPVGAESISNGVAEDDFNKIIAKIETLYRPRVAHYGGTLQIRGEWSNSEVNAYAQREGSNYVVRMLGGLARHYAMTVDAMALVLCHEIGHHIGGVPRYSKADGQWASVEGQADYFANLKCMRHVFLEDDNEAIIKNRVVPNEARTRCEQQFTQRIDQLVCMRTAVAGLASGAIFAALSQAPVPTLEGRDPSVVSATFESHPRAQCRVDTYFSASLCPVDEEVEIGQSDARVGVCLKSAGQEFAARPLCWYKESDGGTNPPTGDRPISPTVGGQSTVTMLRPDVLLPISIDVRNVSGAQGFLLEVSKPNQVFGNPDGNAPDPANSLGYEAYRSTFGTYNLLPIKQLPGWGTYQFRLLGLDQNGRPVGRFSQVLTLILRQN
ncbi:MAG: hypothetical protein A2X86_00635 [Bdellovibrionales bacterium GWA2_49_15]|nr:MAG: hypothetical protein A2X86_00635 [Bdellovibrionales bacterium GWA2_49_15]HAZ13229.1 hypothetical protein [Bdellovibrionales bacterium]